METLRVRKNFVFNKELVEKAEAIAKTKHKNFTEALNLYLQAIIKQPALLDEVAGIAKKRTGSFIGMLDGKIGNKDYKSLKKEKYEDFS